MRAFIAIELPGKVREELYSTASSLPIGDAKIRWVKPENMHLTLKFLGEITTRQAEDIGNGLQELVNGFMVTDLEIGGLGAFPNLRKPRVIWVGVQAEQSVTELYESIDRLTADNGIETDTRPFKLHLTLGRVKILKKGSRFPKLNKELSIKNSIVSLNQVTLFKSTLTPGRPIYTRLVEAELPS